MQSKYIVSELISAPSILRVAAAYDMVPREACQFGKKLGWFQYHQYKCRLKQYPMETAKVTVSSEVMQAIEKELNELLHPEKHKDNRYAHIDTSELIKSDSDFFTLRTRASGRRIKAALQAAFEQRYTGKAGVHYEGVEGCIQPGQLPESYAWCARTRSTSVRRKLCQA